jgi:hypothetical protein
MAIVGEPVIGNRVYRVMAPDYIPCFPSLKGSPATEIPRGKLVKFVEEPQEGLWEVEFHDPNDPSFGLHRGMIGTWAWEWLLPVFQKNR